MAKKRPPSTRHSLAGSAEKPASPNYAPSTPPALSIADAALALLAANWIPGQNDAKVQALCLSAKRGAEILEKELAGSEG